MIVQFSTGGRGRDQALRGSSLIRRPDVASRSAGSVNFPTIDYENAAEAIAARGRRPATASEARALLGLRAIA